MYLTCFILTIVFTFPCINLYKINKLVVTNTIWMWCFFVLTSLTVIFFCVCCYYDPGIV